MTPNPVAPTAPKSNDNEMLDVVKWGFYAYAILTVIGALFIGVIFIAMGAGFAAASRHPQPNAPDLAVVGGVMGVTFFFVLLIVAALATLWFFAGRFVGQRKNYVFAFIAACLALPNMPLGTALGVFSIIILSRESVKRQFGR